MCNAYAHRGYARQGPEVRTLKVESLRNDKDVFMKLIKSAARRGAKWFTKAVDEPP
jgi:hypothetical protein